MTNKLILGTAQFGLKYGINNQKGKPSDYEVFEILDSAVNQNIKSLDTADAYGNAIEIISKYHKVRQSRFRILSKFKGLNKLELIEHTKITLDKLRIPYFEALSFHSISEYFNCPQLIDALKYLKINYFVKKIGVSVYTNSELERVIDDENIDVIQLPYNLLDNNNLRGSYLIKAKKNQKEVHVRSVFLQGVFFMNKNSFPRNLDKLEPYIDIIKAYCTEKHVEMKSLALSYAVFNENIDNVIIGVDTTDQLLNNIRSIYYNKNAFRHIDEHIKVREIQLLNPVNWK